MKILVTIANYGNKNLGYLKILIAEYQKMRFPVKIVVLSNIPKDLDGDIDVVVGLPTKNPWSLPFGHKELFRQYQNDYDLFIYSEDDVLITEKHIDAFLRVTDILRKNEITGFLRYEQDNKGNNFYSTVHSHFHWDPRSVKRIDDYIFAHYTNDHSGCFILTRDQLKRAIKSGGFLVPPHEGKYDLLCSAATDPYTQCGMRKMICISHLEEFRLHHIPNVYLGKIGLAEEEFNLQVEAMISSIDKSENQFQLVNTETKFNTSLWNKNYYEPIQNEIIEIISKTGLRILSVGSGWGDTEIELKNMGHRVSVIPIDYIISAKLKARGIDALPPDIEQSMQNLSGTLFDNIIFANILQYFEHPAELMKLFSELLSPNGSIILSLNSLNNVLFFTKKLKRKNNLNIKNNFSQDGIHFAKISAVNDWCRYANLKINTLVYKLHPKLSSFHSILPKWVKGQFSTQIILKCVKD